MDILNLLKQCDSVLRRETEALRRVSVLRTMGMKVYLLSVVVFCALGIGVYYLFKMPNQPTTWSILFYLIPGALWGFYVATNWIRLNHFIDHGAVLRAEVERIGFGIKGMDFVHVTFQLDDKKFHHAFRMSRQQSQYIQSYFLLVIDLHKPSRSEPLHHFAYTDGDRSQLLQCLTDDWISRTTP